MVVVVEEVREVFDEKFHDGGGGVDVVEDARTDGVSGVFVEEDLVDGGLLGGDLGL